MTQDEIIRMAREAGPDWWLNTTMLERFAALVAAHEAEKWKAENKLDHFRDATKKVAEQAEQEPVAWLRPACVDNFATHNYKTCERTDYGAFPTYAAPVRTKDLTEEDINELWNTALMIADPTAGNLRFKFARAVIAAYKEKNK